MTVSFLSYLCFAISAPQARGLHLPAHAPLPLLTWLGRRLLILRRGDAPLLAYGERAALKGFLGPRGCDTDFGSTKKREIK